MEAGALGRELDQDRDGAVGLRAGLGEEAVGDLALHHHAPRLEIGREAIEALDDERRGDVVRQVRDELVGRRLERASVERERVAPVKRRPRDPAQVRLERAVDLDGVDVCDAVGEEAGQDAEARADLEHDVGGVELGETPDHAEDVLVDEEVLAERLLRDDGHRPKAARRVRVDLRPSSAARPAHLGESRERVHDVRGLVTCAANGLRGEVRAVGLGEEPVGRDATRRLAQLGRLRIGDVAGERDVPAALERRLEQRRRGEAVEDRPCPSKPASTASVSSSAARVWITTGLPELGARARAGARRARCCASRGA